MQWGESGLYSLCLSYVMQEEKAVTTGRLEDIGDRQTGISRLPTAQQC